MKLGQLLASSYFELNFELVERMVNSAQLEMKSNFDPVFDDISNMVY